MKDNNTIFQHAIGKLLCEIFDGPPSNEGFVLNPDDPGLLRQLDTIDAQIASTRPMPGKTTIAAHVDHICYGLSLLNRWSEGEANPWADADWDASWKRTVVNDEQWRSLRTDLRRQSEAWRKHLSGRSNWDDLAASGTLASAAHTAYHLGAIRQILAAMKEST